MRKFYRCLWFYCQYGCADGACVSQVAISSMPDSIPVGKPTTIIVSMNGAKPAYYIGTITGFPPVTKTGATATFTITCKNAGSIIFSADAFGQSGGAAGSSGIKIGSVSKTVNCIIN